jgi:hypothetical protein
MSTEQHAELRVVRRERSVGSFESRIFWLIGIGVLAVVLFVLSARANELPIGFAIVFILGVVYVFGILFSLAGGGMSYMALYYRHLSHWFRNWRRYNSFVSRGGPAGAIFGIDEHGKTFIEPEMRRKVPKIKGLGKISFKSYQLSSKGGSIGIGEDYRFGTISGTALVAGSSQKGDDLSRKLRRMANWGEVLNRMASVGSAVYRFAWSVQTLIGEPQDPAVEMEAVQKGQNLPLEGGPNRDIYLRGVEDIDEKSVTHVTTMSISLRPKDVSKNIKKAGGMEGVLVTLLQDFYASVTGKRSGGVSPVGITTAQFLRPSQLVLLCRLRLDPVFGRAYWHKQAELMKGMGKRMLNPRFAIPPNIDMKKSPEHCILGKTVHIGLVISEFPSNGMTEDHLAAILEVPVEKTVTAVYQMVPKPWAQMRAEWSTSSRDSDTGRRAKRGRRVTEAQAEAVSIEQQHEREIAQRQGQVARLTLYIDVTGGTDEIEKVQANASQVRIAALNAGLWVEYLDYRQHEGIDAVMPLTRGLDARSAPSWIR